MAALLRQREQGGEWHLIWCLRRQHLIHDVGSLCISPMWLFNFFLLERTLKQELQGQKGPRQIKANLTIVPSSATKHNLLIPPVSLHLLLSSSSSFLSSLSSSFSPSFRRFGRPPGTPFSPAGTFRTGTGMSAYRPGPLFPPQVPK